MKQKVIPHNVDAEISIIGGLILDTEAWDHVSDILDEDDFYVPAHRIFFKCISKLNKRNQPVDLLTVTNELQNSQEGQDANIVNYLAEMVSRVISAANIVTYAEIVREKALARRIIKTCSNIIEETYDQDYESIDSYIDSVEGKVFGIGNQVKTSGLVGSMEIVKASLEKIESLYEQKSEITGIATGIKSLDKMTAGMQPGELVIVAARPSMGKTAFSLTMALNMVLKEKKTVAYFSVEMGKEAVMMRLLASHARINLGQIRNGKIPDSSWGRLIESAKDLSDSNLYIDDTSGISPFEIRARCRRLKSQNNLDAIIIDYLQLMDLKLKVESRERAVAEISKTLKSIARELQVPVIALAQLNRGVEGRQDRRPMLSDLRESGSIEQDADVIMLLYREGYYDRDDEEKAKKAEVIIGKQRNGPTGSVPLLWEAEYGLFKEDNSISYGDLHPGPNPSEPPTFQANPNSGANMPPNFAPQNRK